jgi:hypothetical protein
MPHIPRGRSSRYGYTVQANWTAWEKHFESGNCNPVQSQFYRPKPNLQLFNTDNDPWHVSNLAGKPEQQERIKELSDELDRWMIETSDIGLIPEAMFYDLAGQEKKYKTIYEYAQSTEYPVEIILEAAKTSSIGIMENVQEYIGYLKDDNPIIRYWGAYALFLVRSDDALIQKALYSVAQNDPFAANRIMAAQALGLCGDADRSFETIMKEVNSTDNGYIFLLGLNAFQYSHTDDRLSREDWAGFKERTFPGTQATDNYGREYSHRIINEALELWPDRRIVD